MSDPNHFSVPLAVDLAAVAVGALSGVTVAAKKRFDIIGACVLALVTGLGGALLRDGLFIQSGPPAVMRHEYYVLVAVATAVFTPVLLRMPRHLARVADWMDTVAIGLYGMIGAETALANGLGYGPAVFVGAVNAVGGGLIRDTLCNEESALFKPGAYYAAAVVAGAAVFVFLTAAFKLDSRTAGIVGFLVVVGVRVLAVVFNLRTHPVTPAPRSRP